MKDKWTSEGFIHIETRSNDNPTIIQEKKTIYKLDEKNKQIT